MQKKKRKLISFLITVMMLATMSVVLPAKAIAAPTISIDVVDEVFKGLDPGVSYFIWNDSTTVDDIYTADAQGQIPVYENMIGQDLTFAEEILNSPSDDIVEIHVPARITTPSSADIAVTAETAYGENDGTITIPAARVGYWQIKGGSFTDWTTSISDVWEDLAPGTYQIRSRAQVMTDPPPGVFASDSTQVVVVAAEAPVVPVCVNVDTSVEYATLQEAVLAASSGQTILLLTNIDEDCTISLSAAELTIDMDGFDIALNTGYITLGNAATITIEGGGSLSAKFILADGGSEAAITADTINVQQSIDASDNSVVTIVADINASESAVIASGDSEVSVVGNIIAGSDGVNAANGAEISIQGSITAENVGVVAGTGGSVTVTGDITAGSSGVYATSDDGDAPTVTVVGNIQSDFFGVDAISGAMVFVTGDIDAVYIGVYADSAAFVDVTGNINSSYSGVVTYDLGTQVNLSGNIVIVIDPSMLEGDLRQQAAVYAQSGAVVFMDGNISVTGDIGTGIWVFGEGLVEINGNIDVVGDKAYGVLGTGGPDTNGSAVINVNGDIKAVGSGSVGVLSAYEARVTVEKTITAEKYIVLVDVTQGNVDEWMEFVYTAENYDPTTQKAGYRQYSGVEPVSYVWVRYTPEEGTTITTPATGDSLGAIAVSVSSLITIVGTATLVERRRLSTNA
ncbi:MAG: hypothetical protein FWH40_08040 [Coriobacteriia bacterium]|nr:hypothetical protein [Coriobacteriia bacterium]